MIESPNYYRKIQKKIKTAIRENSGFPFIAGFMILLFAAAVLLTVGWASVAEATATCAYFTLAIGVVLQLVCLGKNRLKNGAVFHGSG